MSCYNVEKIYPWLYRLHDALGAYCYLSVGENKAVLFDTGFGLTSLRDAINKVTDKPIITVLGHGHLDHSSGAYQFDEVWLHEADFDLFHEHTSKEWRENFINGLDKKAIPQNFDSGNYINAPAPKLKKLSVGQVFNLGGLHMEVIGMEGHSAGSIGLLAREHCILLNSDAANNHIWMFLPCTLPISKYTAMLERTLTLEFDTFFTGHSDEAQPKSEMNKYLQVARNASFEKSEPYEAMPEFNGFFYQENGAGIVFNKKTLC